MTAGAYARNYGGTVKEIRKAERVNRAFQQVLDDPGGRRAAAAPRTEAAARRGCRLGIHGPRRVRACPITSPARERSPSRSRTSPICMRSRARSARAISCSVLNTLPFAQPTSCFSDGLVYRFRLRRSDPE